MTEIAERDWKELLTLLLAQRLELNALESALKSAGILSAEETKAVRQQAAETARAWTAKEGDDALRLLRVHSSPHAIMTVPGRMES